VARPRLHDLDQLLDHARELWAEDGPNALTIRALSTRSGVSNGAIYNAFGSRANLLARVWAREAEAFLRFQAEAATGQLGDDDRTAAVVAAALAPADYVRHHEASAARLLLSVRPDDLLQEDLGPDERARLLDLRRRLGRLVRQLAEHVWGRSDPTTTTLIRYCVVDLPGALLLADDRITDPLARHALEHAVRGITGHEPTSN
jgi:AcrR family transcriptional regulator